ncbi:hypothetical protein QNN00_25045 [Bacillus velezensis]|nr:hypothetical protein [Bacillus velezensis]
MREPSMISNINGIIFQLQYGINIRCLRAGKSGDHNCLRHGVCMPTAGSRVAIPPSAIPMTT